MIKSIVTQRGHVSFAPFLAERIYMREFTKKAGLPKDIARWQDTVSAMLDGIDTDGPIYIMVDQKEVKANQLHRRGGLHIDGYWNPGVQAWSQPGPSWLYAGGHGHGHGRGTHNPRLPGHSTGHRFVDDWPAEAIILASDVQGCRAYEGEFSENIGEGGDMQHIDVSGLKEVSMTPGVCYAGNVTMLHESIPLRHDALRTVVRLNVPGWSP